MSQKSETSYKRVTDQLRREIVAGEIPLGSWLRMGALAERYGVSVQPVREALQQLEGEGLIEMLPNRGARVRGIDRRRLVHVHEVGEAIESYMARQFAEEASPAQIRALEALQGAHDAAIADLDWPRIDSANYAFHRFILLRDDNQEAAAIVARHYGLSESLLYRHGRTDAYAARVQNEHHAILDAFRRRDGEAARRLSAVHVRNTLAFVLESYAAITGK
jgi:DNA-binding GntR family transcriptional regulator